MQVWSGFLSLYHGEIDNSGNGIKSHRSKDNYRVVIVCVRKDDLGKIIARDSRYGPCRKRQAVDLGDVLHSEP